MLEYSGGKVATVEYETVFETISFFNRQKQLGL